MNKNLFLEAMAEIELGMDDFAYLLKVAKRRATMKQKENSVNLTIKLDKKDTDNAVAYLLSNDLVSKAKALRSKRA